MEQILSFQRQCLRVPHRHRADRTFREVLAFNTKRVVKSRSIILPRDHRGELHKRSLAELLAQSCKQSLWNFDRNAGHSIGVFEDKALQVREVMVGRVVVEVYELLGSNPVLSADGRTDVNSKATSD